MRKYTFLSISFIILIIIIVFLNKNINTIHSNYDYELLLNDFYGNDVICESLSSDHEIPLNSILMECPASPIFIKGKSKLAQIKQQPGATIHYLHLNKGKYMLYQGGKSYYKNTFYLHTKSENLFSIALHRAGLNYIEAVSILTDYEKIVNELRKYDKSAPLPPVFWKTHHDYFGPKQILTATHENTVLSDLPYGSYIFTLNNFNPSEFENVYWFCLKFTEKNE